MAAEKSQEKKLPDTGLLLVGMGMGHVNGMTVEALEAAAAADHRRYEAYTALWPEEDLVLLEQRIGAIERVMRPEVEEPTELFKLAETSLVALLIVGDPLQATTHVDLQLRARSAGIDCRVFHGVSITSLVTGAVGLSNYKFGRQTTFTYPYGTWVATSPLEVLASNWGQGLHTLALLDLDPTGQGTGDQRPMKPKDAAQTMRMMWTKATETMEEHRLEPALQQITNPYLDPYLEQDLEGLPVVLCADMGTSQQSIVATTVGALENEMGGRLNCLVFPSTTGEIEEQALARWERGART